MRASSRRGPNCAYVGVRRALPSDHGRRASVGAARKQPPSDALAPAPALFAEALPDEDGPRFFDAVQKFQERAPYVTRRQSRSKVVLFQARRGRGGVAAWRHPSSFSLTLLASERPVVWRLGRIGRALGGGVGSFDELADPVHLFLPRGSRAGRLRVRSGPHSDLRRGGRVRRRFGCDGGCAAGWLSDTRRRHDPLRRHRLC